MKKNMYVQIQNVLKPGIQVHLCLFVDMLGFIFPRFHCHQAVHNLIPSLLPNGDFQVDPHAFGIVEGLDHPEHGFLFQLELLDNMVQEVFLVAHFERLPEVLPHSVL